MTLCNGLKQEILSEIETIAGDENIFREKNFIMRSQAMDDIEFHVIDRIESLTKKTKSSDHLNELQVYAEKVRSQLDDVNRKMYHQLRSEISKASDRGKVLMNMIKEYLDQTAGPVLQQNESGYDHLDFFINGLLTYRDLPAEIKEREPDMIYYQKTPARIVFEMIKKAAFKPGDIFYDLGSGLGQLTMLVNILTSVISKGVEFEPAYYGYAKATAADLNLPDVEFINADARHADYSSGTVFFMYTPFEGKMLNDVLDKLYAESRIRRVRIFTYGSCTPEVACAHWLTQVSEINDYDNEPGEFVSA